MKDSATTDIYAFIEPFHDYWWAFSNLVELTDQQRETIYAVLFTAYTEPQRAYHTVQHIVECLDLFYKIEHELSDPIAVQTAIWFHDVIYDPKSSDNEQRSAEVMMAHCADFLHPGQLEKVYQWIIATQQHQPSLDADLNTLLDIDLAILGVSSSRFQQYQQQIQSEYAWVESTLYTKKRNAVLKQFFDMQPLFQTAYFQDLFEFNAKKNLSAYIQIENLPAIQTLEKFKTQSANKKIAGKKLLKAEFVQCLNEMILYLLIGIVLAAMTDLISNRFMALFVCILLVMIGYIYFKKKSKQITLQLDHSKSKAFVHTYTLLNHVKAYEPLRVPLLIYVIYLIDKFSCDSLREVAILITQKMGNKQFDLNMVDASLMEKIGEAYSEQSPNIAQIARILSDLLNDQSIDSENIQLIMQNISETFYSLLDHEIAFEDKHLYDLILLKS